MFLRLFVDSLSGMCRIGAVLQGDDLMLESRRILGPGESVASSPRWEAVLSELSRTWISRQAARLEVATAPAGLEASLAGRPVGRTPLSLGGLVPGAAALRLAGPGWDPIEDTLRLEAGSLLHRDYVPRRSQAWLDSVRRAQIAARRDSIWNAARRSPASALGDLFARLTQGVALPLGRQSVAVLPFQVAGAAHGYDPGVMAAEYGVAHLSRDPRFLLVEREGVNRLLREQALALSGAVGDSGAAQVGKLLAARYLVTGTVTVEGARQVFTARMVSVESGEIVSAAVATAGSDSLEELYRTALGERGQLSGSLYRSAAGPGWGQFYTGHPVHGAVALTATLGALGFVGWSYADYSDKDATFKKFRNHDVTTAVAGESAQQWIARAEAARKERNDASTRTNLALAAVGVVWVANLVDAGVLGYRESRRIRAEYFAWAPQVAAQPDGIQLAWRF